MIDLAKMTVKAGDGGNGVISFMQLPGMRHGKPDGGDGGKAGDVYLQATEDLNTLEPFRYVKYYCAESGGRGERNHRKGKDGEDLIIKVPVGTVVRLEGKTVDDRPWTVDLTEAGQQVLVATGGRGGRGNSRFKSATNRSFRFAEKGEEGERRELTLELKLIADVGIIGLPNSGKSTLLSVLTSAKPKIANYPFTTLEPNLGVMTVDPASPKLRRASSRRLTVDKPTSLVLADIPGLIEGASKGKGLGDEFLRHIERTKILVHLIDSSTETDKWQDYQVIKKELKEYGLGLAKKKQIVVLSKIDAVSPDNLLAIEKQFKKHKLKLLKISAVTGEGMEELKRKISPKL